MAHLPTSEKRSRARDSGSWALSKLGSGGGCSGGQNFISATLSIAGEAITLICAGHLILSSRWVNIVILIVGLRCCLFD